MNLQSLLDYLTPTPHGMRHHLLHSLMNPTFTRFGILSTKLLQLYLSLHVTFIPLPHPPLSMTFSFLTPAVAVFLLSLVVPGTSLIDMPISLPFLDINPKHPQKSVLLSMA